jgi:hypothetical protein
MKHQDSARPKRCAFAKILLPVLYACVVGDSTWAKQADESVAAQVATRYSSTLVRGLLETCVSEVARTNGLRQTILSLGPVERMLDPRIQREQVAHAISVITNGDHWIADAFLVYATNGSATAVEAAIGELRACTMVLNQVVESNAIAAVALRHGVVVETACFRPIHIWRCHGSSMVRSSPRGLVPPLAIESLGLLCTTNYFSYYPVEEEVEAVDPQVRKPGMAFLFKIREELHGEHKGSLDGPFDRAGYEQEK